MKILFLTNNTITRDVINWLQYVIHEEVVVVENELTLNVVDQVKPEFIISYSYRFIIKEDIIKLFPMRIINLHIAYLPWNKGAYPNFWSFVDKTPKGVTIHLIDNGVDTGDIILQKEISIDENNETFRSSYQVLHNRIKVLFCDNWNNIKQGLITPVKQQGKGSFHSINDFVELSKQIDEFTWDLRIIDVIRQLQNRKTKKDE